MKGLELSETLFRSYVFPRIEKELPEVIPFLAAGLVGEGSECFGFDDEISRDHDTGLRLCIWLDSVVYGKWESPLHGLLQSAAQDYNCKESDLSSLFQPGRSGIFTIPSFYRMLTGYEQGPLSDEEWMTVLPQQLASAVNGKVFFDAPGTFTHIRERLRAYYPEDVRLMKLAHAAAMAGQTGQYNYPRMQHREDPVALQMIKAYYAEHAVKMLFLLNRAYMPFYKWAYRSLRLLAQSGEEMYSLTEQMFSAAGEMAQEFIEKISVLLIGILHAQGLSDSESDFLMDHVKEILLHVGSDKLRSQGISLLL